MKKEKIKQEVLDHSREYRTRGITCYRSTLLNKVFDKYEDLVEAEEEYEKQNAEKLRLKEERKQEAEEVSKAIEERVKAELAARKGKAEAYKAYLATCDALEQDVLEKKKEEAKLLKAFCTKHPEGFHETIQIGDVKYDCNFSMKDINYTSPFIRLLQDWF